MDTWLTEQDKRHRDTETAPGVKVNDSEGAVLLGVRNVLITGHAIARLTSEQARNTASALLQAAARIDACARPTFATPGQPARPRTPREAILFSAVERVTRKTVEADAKGAHVEGPDDSGAFNLAVRASAEACGLAPHAFRIGVTVGAAFAIANKGKA